MKKLVISSIIATFALAMNAQETPLWLRQASISPDGSTIAFSYKGDIFTVSSQGGEARQLTTNEAFDGNPIWSPDGENIAFNSDREGSLDIYVISRKGGAPKRLTSIPGAEKPMAFLDNSTVIYQANVRPSAESMQFSNRVFTQVYQVAIDGKSRPSMLTSWTMEDLSISPDGNRWLFTDRKGYEDEWRKHHTSVITRDVWCYDKQTETYTKITDFEGEDRNAVWSQDGKTIYYLSEQKGNNNLFRRTLGQKDDVQLTNFDLHPVRHLTRSNNGVMCFSQNGELYTMTDGQQPKKVNIKVNTDVQEHDVIRSIRNSGATDMAVSPSGKEVAFIIRGDVYVTSTEYKTTRQITDTPEQERNIDFAPDGKSLVYSAERNGVWQLWQTSIVGNDDKQLVYADELQEECLTNNDKTSFQPKYSPDGKEIAYLEDRTAIRVINLATRQIRTVMEGKYQYSYSDGDQYFCWSPDSRWLLSESITVGGWHNRDVVLLKADGSEMHNLTESGYIDGNPHWALGGKAMIWQSDRAGYRSHGSWGTEFDEYIVFFDLEAYEHFLLSKEEVALLDEEEKEKDKGEGKSEKSKDDKKTKKGAKADEKKDEVKPLTFDLENAKDRIVRLTVNSSRLGDAFLDKKGEVLYYTASFEGSPDLWKHDLKEDKTTIVKKGVGRSELLTDKDEKYLYVLGRNGMSRMEMGKSESKDITFEAMFNYRPAQERQYMFDHIWRQVNEKFYDPTIRGIDWAGYHEAYQRFLPHINNNYDFQDLLSEFLGELNGSHTGGRYNVAEGPMAVASLGVFFNDNYMADGLEIKEIMPKSPLTLSKNSVTPGCVITHIDGQPIGSAGNENYLLAGKVGKKIVLSGFDQDGKDFKVTVKGISKADETALLYHRWVERNREIVEKATDGRIGYVHIKGMDSPSFRTLFSELLGKYRNCEAVIIDTRHNGGGWLHDDVIALLTGKEHTRYTPRGQYIASDPFNRWTKPSCMLVCEDNYSNAHGTPWLYKEMKVGKLIGTPVPGTMTAVWWETQIDPTIVFGIPQVGAMDPRGNYLENQQLYPDIEVYNKPEDVLQGKDAQLEAAIAEMLKTVGEKK